VVRVEAVTANLLSRLLFILVVAVVMLVVCAWATWRL
jgi:hypothetical protein